MIHGRVIETGLPLRVVDMGGAVDAEARGSETFVLLHGYAATSFTWRHWTGVLANRGRVLLVDMKGFGDAPKPDDDRYSPLDFADLVIELIEQLDLAGVTLVGHSLGGGVALLTAIAFQERASNRVARLILVAAPAYRQPLPPFVSLAKWPRLSSLGLRLAGPEVVIRTTLRSIVFDPASISDDQVDEYSRALKTKEGLRAALATARVIVPESLDQLPAKLRKVDVPALLLWGDTDRVVPLWVGERLLHDLPRARLEVVAECGHLPPEEYPDQSLAIVEAFLDEHPL